MKRMFSLFLALLLLAGCAQKEESSSSVSLLAGETVSGIITKVNGNEITLDLVTLASDRGVRGGGGEAPGDGEEAPSEEPPALGDGEEAPSGELPAIGDGGEAPSGERPSFGDGAQQGERPDRGNREGRGEGRGSGGEDQGGAPSGLPQGAGEPPGGELPQGLPSFEGAAGSGGSQKSYTRTGETALYQIPVGATVLTLTGTSRGFNSLTTDLLVTITFREDGVTPGQVQVIQSLS